jgi:hypothetical protein
MVRSFGPETPVLSYRPRASRAHDPGGRNDRVWLLWPAWAFRVIAPEFRERRINVLQKAVLAILRASKLTAEEMGHRLGINPELAAYVVSELQGQTRVDPGWNVTRAGVELLEEEQMQAASMMPGWVFRDPWNGGLWPFVGSSLGRHWPRAWPPIRPLSKLRQERSATSSGPGWRRGAPPHGS